MDTKGNILQAAITVSSRLGFDQATAKDIAKEAGVAVGTLYNHYRDKADILNAIFGQALQARLGCLQAATEHPGSLPERLDYFLRFHVEAVQHDQELHRLLLQESHRPSNHQLPCVHAFLQDIPKHFMALLGSVPLVESFTAVAKPELAAKFVYQAVLGLTEEILTNTYTQNEAAELREATLALLLHGLLGHGKGETTK